MNHFVPMIIDNEQEILEQAVTSEEQRKNVSALVTKIEEQDKTLSDLSLEIQSLKDSMGSIKEECKASDEGRRLSVGCFESKLKLNMGIKDCSPSLLFIFALFVALF